MIEFLKKQGLRLKLYAYENYQNEAESLLVWYAVAYALGAAFYFAFPYELPVWLLVVFLEAVLLLLYLNNRRDGTFKLLTYLAVFSLGLCVAKANALYQNLSIEKNIEETTYITGQVKVTDYNSSGRRRIELINADNFEKPLKGSYKISLNQNLSRLKPGVCVELIAKFPQNYAPNPLSNYNMDRANFYQGVSASGYAISPVFQKDCEHSPSVIANLITAMRQAVIKALSPANPETQGIIKALTIGDKSAISQSQAADYRTAGLAHFLAISGMHMGMIA
ncbi:MAG: ComEC/Rec2 family competence protein, partial [Alphaproteobacteria bacterium]|nr:ComEC/Rec2 family competence protein [Alphaproteobacteria bacterium]